MQKTIDDCSDCHSVCMETIVYCLEQGKEHAEPAHIRTLYDCAMTCSTLQDFALLSSKGLPKMAEACAEVCDICADNCERYEGDAPLIECAEVCRRCAGSARMLTDIRLVRS